MEAAAAFAPGPGQRVLARYSNGEWYPAVLGSEREVGCWDVTFEDDGVEVRGVGLDCVRPLE